jgi:hypothetical protein
VSRPYLFFAYQNQNPFSAKSLKFKLILQFSNSVLSVSTLSGEDQNNRQETGMKKSLRWRFAIAISALSIIFVSAALAG